MNRTIGMILVGAVIVLFMTASFAWSILGDINDDDKVGLQESIYAQRVVANLAAPITNRSSAIGTLVLNADYETAIIVEQGKVDTLTDIFMNVRDLIEIDHAYVNLYFRIKGHDDPFHRFRFDEKTTHQSMTLVFTGPIVIEIKANGSTSYPGGNIAIAFTLKTD